MTVRVLEADQMAAALGATCFYDSYVATVGQHVRWSPFTRHYFKSATPDADGNLTELGYHSAILETFQVINRPHRASLVEANLDGSNTEAMRNGPMQPLETI